jgi:hypothetical protein
VVEAPAGTIWALGPGAVWNSPDGASWVPADASAFADGFAWNAVAYGNAIVAVGQATGPSGTADAAVWLLLDGAWTRLDPVTFDVPGAQYLREVTFDPVTRRLVAIGTDSDIGDAVVWTSEDGSTWQRSHPIPGGAYQGLSSILFLQGTPGTFIAAGWNGVSEAQRDATAWYSPDGIDWSVGRGRLLTYDLHGPGAQEIRALTYGSGRIVVVAFGTQGIGKIGEARLWNGAAS